jgi:hypothetical protein
MCTANATPAEMSATAAVSTSAEMSAAATTSAATMAATSAMTSASAAAFCVSSACKNGGQEDNGTELEFWHGNLERAPPRVTDVNDSPGR